ncbi:MAG TPA: DUF86 domain-containing protein [Bacteroidia bacterium]|nr:DUF86 domain-containing protein [Bacteroidia bacterium]HNU32493.1 DUF86 domain-containing protein [Bacteroidia bacterium]
MQREVKKYLFDILECINSIEEYTFNVTTYSEFKNNKKTYRAVERELEIIGEVIVRLRNSHSEVIINNSAKIIGLRNRIAHDYENVNDDIIWGIIKNHILPLKKEVQNLLNTNS